MGAGLGHMAVLEHDEAADEAHGQGRWAMVAVSVSADTRRSAGCRSRSASASRLLTDSSRTRIGAARSSTLATAIPGTLKVHAR